MSRLQSLYATSKSLSFITSFFSKKQADPSPSPHQLLLRLASTVLLHSLVSPTMAELVQTLVQKAVQDIRTDALLTLDPRVWTTKEATAAILLTGGCAQPWRVTRVCPKAPHL